MGVVNQVVVSLPSETAGAAKIDPLGFWCGAYTFTSGTGGCTCRILPLFCYQVCWRNCSLNSCDTCVVGGLCPPAPFTTTIDGPQCGCARCNPPQIGGNSDGESCCQSASSDMSCFAER